MKDTINQSELKKIALELYGSPRTAEKYMAAFKEKLKTYTVIDKRDDGYYCGMCGRFSNSEYMSSGTRTIYPNNHEKSKELWIVNAHHNGS